MTAPLYHRRCIQCDTYHDLMHFAADSRVCDACAVAAAGGA